MTELQKSDISTGEPSFQDQDCPLTVRQGLAQFYRLNPHITPFEGESDRDRFFQAHDTLHVVFGCSTELSNEVFADCWAIFGSNVGLGPYAAYLNDEEAQNILKEIGYWKATVAFVQALPRAAQLWWRSTRMPRPWPWLNHQHWLDRPLADVRRQFGIKVMGPA